MSRHHLILLILSLFSFSVTGQSQFREGQITDGSSEEGVPFANVYFQTTKQGTTADEKGRFKIPLEMKKGDQVRISSSGYRLDSFLISGKNNQRFHLFPSKKELQEVVISGTMTEIQRKESVIPIEIYTPALFKKTWSPTLMESVNMINGVQPQLNCNVCSAGDIHINGLEGPYTMILIDGMPIVSSLSTIYGLAGIPQSLIKRIEVVKGPASTLYGSEALAGIINVITKDANSTPLFRAEFSATSIGESNLDVSTKWKAGKHQSMLGINAFQYSIPKDINKDNFTDLALQKRISVFNKWDFQSSGTGKKSLAVRLLAEDRWGGEMQWNTRWRGSDSVYGESIETRRAEILGTLPISKDGQLRWDYSYNYHQQNSWYGKTVFDARQHTAFSQLVWSGKKKRWNWVTGVPVRYTVYDDNTPATGGNTENKFRNQPQYTLLPGIFGQTEYQANEKITGLVGLRMDLHPVHGTIFTPRAGLKWKINPSQNFRISGGSGFRVVSVFTEDHAALTGSRTVIIKNTLQPEKSWNVNLGHQWFINHKNGFSNLEINVFYTRFSNQIIGDFTQDPEKIIYDNLDGYGISRGVSVNYDWSNEKGWKLLLGATWMQVFQMRKEATDGSSVSSFQKQTQLFAPPLSGTFSLSYRKSTWAFDLTGRVNGPMKLPVFPKDYRPEWSPVYPLVNLQATHPMRKGTELYFGIRNLLNFIPKDPILRPFDPFDKSIQIDNPNHYTFDPSYHYAPVQGTTLYAGFRWTIN